MSSLLIVGSTGVVGRLVVRALSAANSEPIALVRDAMRAREALGETVSLRVADLANPAALKSALVGVDGLFLATPNSPNQFELERNLIDAAAHAGVRRMVKLSALGADEHAPVRFWRTHAAIEAHLAASGLTSVSLRPAYFMSNLLGVARAVQTISAVPAALGTARIAMVDPADLAAVAAAVLTREGDFPATLDITGPQALTFDDVAGEFTRALGRPIRFLDLSPEQAAQSLQDNGVPPGAVAGVLEVLVALRQGRHAAISPTVQEMLGRPANTLEDFIHDHLDLFHTNAQAAPA